MKSGTEVAIYCAQIIKGGRPSVCMEEEAEVEAL
jgi:hypothetical protein